MESSRTTPSFRRSVVASTIPLGAHTPPTSSQTPVVELECDRRRQVMGRADVAQLGAETTEPCGNRVSGPTPGAEGVYPVMFRWALEDLNL